MKDVKLPDLEMIKQVSGKTLPSQSSAEDTSNWDDRAFSTPNPERDLVLIEEDELDSVELLANPYVEQELRKAAKKKL